MKRIGIVGVGAIAQSYLRALEGCDFARVVAVADVRQEVAQAAAKAADCEAFGSYKNMADKFHLDAVIVCTPPNSHPEIVGFFHGKGVHVLCEKPLATDLDNAHSITQYAKDGRTLVTMASKFRYVDDVIRLREIISSGLLGDILLLENSFASPVDMADRWNSQPEISGGGVLIDNGTHSVDIIRYLLGPITKVLAITDTSRADLRVEDNAHLFIDTANGARAHVDLSWSYDKQFPNYISVYGTNGTAHVGWKESKYKKKVSNDWFVFGNGYNKFQAFRSNVKNFCAAIDSQEPPLISIFDALASVKVIAAAYASSKQGAWVPINQNGEAREMSSLSVKMDAAQ